MPQIDRATARALTEAGYMPLREYILTFGDEVAAETTTELAKETVTIGAHRSRPWSVPAHFARPARASKYRVSYQWNRPRAAS
jgi:hypothetical protein